MGQRPISLLPLLSLFGVLSALAGSFSAFGTTLECLKFDISTHLGHAVDHPNVHSLELYDSNSRYFMLGEGSNGAVYRVVPLHGEPSYVLKEYSTSQRRNSDMVGFLRLHRGMPHVEGVEVIHPQIIGKKSMRLPDVQGQTLAKVLQDPKISEAEKNHLIATWNHFLEQANAALPKGPGVFRHDLDKRDPAHIFEMIFVDNNIPYTLWLKPDNVIVQAKTGHLFLIDPY